MPFEPIGKIITQGRWRQGPAKIALTGWSVEKALAEILKTSLPSLADKIGLANYREGKLILKTPSSSVSQEVYLNSKQITDKLNEFFERKVVEKMGFRVSRA